MLGWVFEKTALYGLAHAWQRIDNSVEDQNVLPKIDYERVQDWYGSVTLSDVGWDVIGET